MVGFVTGFINDESGATSIQYSLLVAGIVFAAAIAINSVGTSFAATFWENANELHPGPAGMRMGAPAD